MMALLRDASEIVRVYIVPFNTMELPKAYNIVRAIANAQNKGCMTHVDDSGYVLCTTPLNLNRVMCDITLTYDKFGSQMHTNGRVLLLKCGNSVSMACDSCKATITSQIRHWKMANSGLIMKYNTESGRFLSLPITHQLTYDECRNYESSITKRQLELAGDRTDNTDKTTTIDNTNKTMTIDNTSETVNTVNFGRQATEMGKNTCSRKAQLPRNSDKRQNSARGIYGSKSIEVSFSTKSQNANKNLNMAKIIHTRQPIEVSHPAMPRNTDNGTSMGRVGRIRKSKSIKVISPTISLIKGKQSNITNCMYNGEDYRRPTFPVQASDGPDQDSSELLLNSSQWESSRRPAIATSSAYSAHERTESQRFAPNSRARASVLQNEHSQSAYPRLEPRHPEFSALHTRIGSYNNWPHPPRMQDKNKMANYGLFFTGRDDLVRCFQCGIGMKDWSYNDDPLLEHLRYVPECSYLRYSVDAQELAHYKNLLSPSTYRHSGASNTGASSAQPTNPAAAEACIHPTYREYNVRLASYSKWPPSKIQTARMLTDAGFYYTGYEDAVRCYSCDGGLQRWDPEDDPWIEHARWFPHCSYLRREKGDDYIQLIQMSMAEDREVDDEEASGIANGMASLQIYHDPTREKPTRESEDPVYSPAAQRVIESGFSKAAVKMAIAECSLKGMRWNAETLMNILLEKLDRGETLPPDSPRSESPLPVTDDLSEDPLSQQERLLSRIMCIRCEVNQANSLFLPCAHHRMCVDCAQDVSVCPMCGKDVREKIKTFMA